MQVLSISPHIFFSGISKFYDFLCTKNEIEQCTKLDLNFNNDLSLYIENDYLYYTPLSEDCLFKGHLFI